MAIVWDGDGRTWRHELTKGRKKEYKGNRSNFSKIRKIVNTQIPIVKELWQTLGIWNFEVPKLEADDLIGILATYISYDEETQVIIYSGDRDFQQLLSDKIVIWASQGRNGVKGTIIGPDYVEKQWGVLPKDYRKMRAFCGDSTDNIAKIMDKLGPKTAVKLLKSGLDPSVSKFNKFKMEVFNQYSDKFASVWSLVHDNYHLCKIITKVTNSHLSKEIKLQVMDIFKQIDEKGIQRQNWNIVQYRKLLDYLIKYELDEIFDRRDEILKLI
jgi:5'-3' exonuclease